MFEGISGGSKGKQSKLGLATAIGLHAAVIGAVLAGATLKTAPPATIEPTDVIRWPTPTRGHGIRPGHPQAETPPTKPSNSKPNTQRPPGIRPMHLQKPRQMMAEETAQPVEPESISAPLQPSSAMTSALSEPGALQPGDGSEGEPGDAKAAACPAGAVCSSSGEEIYLWGSAMSRPRADCVPPAPLAPYAARQYGLEGRVVARFVVHADGRADSLNVLNSDAPPVYVEAVREWIERCNFVPAQISGEPKSVKMVQSFHFATGTR